MLQQPYRNPPTAHVSWYLCVSPLHWQFLMAIGIFFVWDFVPIVWPSLQGSKILPYTFTTRKRNIVWVNGKIRSRINGFQETTRHKYQVLGLLWAHQTRVSNNESVSLVSKESLQALRAYLHTITWYLVFTFNSNSILTTFDGLWMSQLASLNGSKWLLAYFLSMTLYS